MTAFPERLSFWVVLIAAIGAFLVLIDPQVELAVRGQTLKLGGEGFSSELKGAVITIMLIGGWTAVMSFWLGQSESGQQQAKAMSRIAEQSAPVAASAVAAATGAGGGAALKTDTVNVQSDVTNVSSPPSPPT